MEDLLQPSGIGISPSGQVAVDILELNCSRRSLLIGSHVQDQRLSSLVSLIETRIPISKNKQEEASHAEMKDCSIDSFLMNIKLDHHHEENATQSSKIQDSHRNDMLLEHKGEFSNTEQLTPNAGSKHPLSMSRCQPNDTELEVFCQSTHR